MCQFRKTHIGYDQKNQAAKTMSLNSHISSLRCGVDFKYTSQQYMDDEYELNPI